MTGITAESFQRVIIYIIPMLFGIICHEVAHGFVAWRFGDPTAKSLGRLTLNPVPHIDPMGILVFVITALAAPFSIGWAKPVPVDARYFKNPRRDMAIVSLAGPITNFILALLFALAMWLIHSMPTVFFYVMDSLPVVWRVLQAGLLINFVLGWFNLIPLPPLDGSHILHSLLPRSMATTYYRIARYGMLIIIVLLATGLLQKILGPLVTNSVGAVINTLNLPFLTNWL